MPQYMGSEERLRAQQLIRGTVSGKRVASKSTIASLQSVEMSELTDSERSKFLLISKPSRITLLTFLRLHNML